MEEAIHVMCVLKPNFIFSLKDITFPVASCNLRKDEAVLSISARACIIVLRYEAFVLPLCSQA